MHQRDTAAEFRQHLAEHLDFLKASAAAFDQGFEAEAKRMAVSARVLLHDTSSSHSLLAQLGLLHVTFYSSAVPRDPEDLLQHHGLLQVQVRNGESSYRAPLDFRPPHILRWVPFDDWWREIVFDDRKSMRITRRDIVLALANKDGGAHVDPQLSPSYERLSRHKTFGSWMRDTPEGPRPLAGSLELLAMRQITHELLTTLDRHTRP